MSAVIALERASQLRSAGEEVGGVAGLDSCPPDPALCPPALTGGAFSRLKGAVALVTTGVLPDRGLGHYLRFHRQGVALQRRHRTAPWGGRTLVLVAEGDEAAPARALWAPHLSGRWSLHEVPGDHVGMLHEPNVAPVADLLAAELDEVDARRRADAPAR